MFKFNLITFFIKISVYCVMKFYKCHISCMIKTSINQQNNIKFVQIKIILENILKYLKLLEHNQVPLRNLLFPHQQMPRGQLRRLFPPDRIPDSTMSTINIQGTWPETRREKEREPYHLIQLSLEILKPQISNSSASHWSHAYFGCWFYLETSHQVWN